MTSSKRWIKGLLALTIFAGICMAEEAAPPPKFYKLEFVVKEVAGSKVLNSRTYMTIVSTSGGNKRDEIRAGSKVPYATSPGTYQQIDVGVSFDLLKITEMQDRLWFQITAEVSSVAEGTEQAHPTIRQNRWGSEVIVPLKKPTLLFSSENVDAKTEVQVEVTATPIP